MKRNIVEEYGISRIVNYLRRSRQDEEREKKTGEDTLHEQKMLMDRALSEYGIPYEQKSEIGSGDKISSRPVFQQIIKDLQHGKYDAIAVKEISRLGRGSYTDMGTIYDLITQKNIYIITPWKVYDPKNPSDLRQIRFELFMSREEFETTRERLNGGRFNAAMEGKWVSGSAPFGYQYNPNTKRLEIKEDEAEIVRTVYDFYANGILVNGERKLVQFRALSTYLKRIGIKTPKGKDTWHPTYLRTFLSNETYNGTLKFRTTKRKLNSSTQVPRPEDEWIIVEDAHPAIIDPVTWEKVQYRINNRDTTNTKLDFDPCELAGICVCVECGHKLIRQYSTQHYKKADGTETVYHKEFLWCRTPGCTFVKYRSIEEDLLETLKYLSELNDNLLNEQIKHLIVTDSKAETNVDELQKHVESRKQELNRRLKFIHEKYETGVYDDEEFIQRRNELKKEIEELEQIKIDVPDEKESIEPKFIKTQIKSILEAYQASKNKSDKNKILRAVFDHVDVKILEKGRGRKPAVHQITPYLKSSFLSQKRA